MKLISTSEQYALKSVKQKYPMLSPDYCTKKMSKATVRNQ